MATLFGRKYSLIVGRQSKITQAIIPLAITDPALLEQGLPGGFVSGDDYVDVRTIPERFTEFTEVQMQADILYTKDSTSQGGSQNSTIKLYNLSKTSRNRIREDDLVIFRAGYDFPLSQEGDFIDTSVGIGRSLELPLIFVGQIISVYTKKKGQNRITTITCGDAIVVKKNVKITQSWIPTTSKLTVLQDMIAVANGSGVPTGKLIGVTNPLSPWGGAYPSGYAASGLLFDEIQRLCDGVGYRFYTVLGKLYVEPKVATTTVALVKLTSDNIKGGVDRETDNTKTLSGSAENKTGIKINTFLDGRITTDKFLELTGTDDSDGTYQIKSVSHKLDLEGSKWDTEVSCVVIGESSG